MQVGLVMRIKREWLDHMPLLVCQNLNWSEAREALLGTYTFPEPSRKIMNALRHTWYGNEDFPPSLHQRAARVFQVVGEKERGVVHGLLLTRAFPFVQAVMEVLHGELQFQESIRVQHLRKQLERRFGVDSSLHEALPKVTATLHEAGVVCKENHTLTRMQGLTFEHPEFVAWCLECLLTFHPHAVKRIDLEDHALLLGHHLHLTQHTVNAAEGVWSLFTSGGREQMLELTRFSQASA